MNAIKSLLLKAGLFKESAGQSSKKAMLFFGIEAFAKKKTESNDDPNVDKSAIKAPEQTAEEQVSKILLDNPKQNAATLLNTLKAQGLTVVKQEADGLSSATQVTRAKSKESKEVSTKITARFLEAGKTDPLTGPTKFKVALIQEGLGNLRDGFYYSKEAIESGVLAFEGKKCFADHPSNSESTDRPERSVRDIVGHFEDLAIEESEGGAAMLVGNLVMLADPQFGWARALVKHAVAYGEKYPDKNFIGLSINASGDAEEMPADKFLDYYKIPDAALPKIKSAIQEGMTTVRVVSTIRDAISTDIVTEPGAKGKVLSMIESIEGKKMKHAEKHEAEKHEADKHEAEEKESAKHEAEEAPEQDGEEAPEHDDEEQDKKLIMDMIKKYMGDEHAEAMESEEAHTAAHEAYEAYKEMGMKHEEACEAAGHAMKLAKHMADKKTKEAEKAHESDKEEKEEEEEEKKETHKESAVVRLAARVAFLERELKKVDLSKSFEKKLKESGLGRAETDKIRQLVGTPKSEAQVSEVIKIFKEAIGSSRGESTKSNPFLFAVEKTTVKSKSGTGFDFSECLRK